MGRDDDSIASIYFIRCVCAEMPIKIGRAKDPLGRMAELQVASPFALEMMASFVCGLYRDACAAEVMLHQRLSRFQLRGEWFSREAEPYVLAVIEELTRRRRRVSVGTVLASARWAPPDESPRPLATKTAVGVRGGNAAALAKARAKQAKERRAAFRAAIWQQAANRKARSKEGGPIESVVPATSEPISDMWRS